MNYYYYSVANLLKASCMRLLISTLHNTALINLLPRFPCASDSAGMLSKCYFLTCYFISNGFYYIVSLDIGLEPIAEKSAENCIRFAMFTGFTSPGWLLRHVSMALIKGMGVLNTFMY